MAKAPSYSTGLRNAVLNGTDWTNIWDLGRLTIYDDTGTRPADADATETGGGTILAEITLPSPAFAASAAAGALAKSGTWQDGSANDSGAANWFRMYDVNVTLGQSSSAVRMDGTVGVNTGVWDIAFDNINFVAADPITIDTFVVTIPLNQ
jgi:hypothetical protein